MLSLIIPSRSRPAKAAQAAHAAKTLSTGDVRIIVAVDDNDPELAHYHDVIPAPYLVINPPSRIGPLLNKIASQLLEDDTEHIAFMGDDHRVRTTGWDIALSQAAVAYGNDFIHGAALPTSFVVHADIVRALGYLVPPGIWHLYFDNAMLDIGHRYGLVYAPDVIIEHVHPLAGKAEWDESYARNNDAETDAHDHAVYDAWSAAFRADTKKAPRR